MQTVESFNGKKGMVTLEPYDDSIEILNSGNHIKILANRKWRRLASRRIYKFKSKWEYNIK